MRKLLGLRVLAMAYTAQMSAHAAACPGSPLSNGTTADASQVMAWLDCKAPLNNPSFSGTASFASAVSLANAGNATFSAIGGPGVSGHAYGGLFAANNGTSILALGNVDAAVGGYTGTNDLIAISTSADFRIGTSDNHALWFTINGWNNKVGGFGTDGSFLVGTNSNGGSFGIAKIEGKAADGGIGVGGYAPGSTGYALHARVDSTGATLLQMNYAFTGVGAITTNGVNVTYGGTSDARLKLIDPHQKDLRDTIANLWVGGFRKWDNFSHTGTSTESFGVLAQQAYDVLPADLRTLAIVKPSDANGIWMASSEPFAFLALWGVKDIYRQRDDDQKRIKSLQEEITTLKMALLSQEKRLVRTNERLDAFVNREGARLTQR